MNKTDILQMLWSLIVLSEEIEVISEYGIRTTVIDKNSLLNAISNEIMCGEEDEDLCS